VLQRAFFLLPPWVGMISATRSFGDGELPDSAMNWFMVPEMVGTRSRWDEPGPDGTRSLSWLDGLKKTDNEALRQEAERTRCGLSERGWERLSDGDRDTLLAIETTRLKLSEDVQILAPLIEACGKREEEAPG